MSDLPQIPTSEGDEKSWHENEWVEPFVDLGIDLLQRWKRVFGGNSSDE